MTEDTTTPQSVSGTPTRRFRRMRRLALVLAALVIVVLVADGIWKQKFKAHDDAVAHFQGVSENFTWLFDERKLTPLGNVFMKDNGAPTTVGSCVPASVLKFLFSMQTPPDMFARNFPRLSLAGRKLVTDDDWRHLKNLRNLKELSLGAVSDTELLHHVKGLTGLVQFDVFGRDVTDSGLEVLNYLTDLEVLSLSNTQVSDQGLVHVRGLTNLRELDLAQTQITDAGLVHLKRLKNLQKIKL